LAGGNLAMKFDEEFLRGMHVALPKVLKFLLET
jgi:hypothetical protein